MLSPIIVKQGRTGSEIGTQKLHQWIVHERMRQGHDTGIRRGARHFCSRRAAAALLGFLAEAALPRASMNSMARRNGVGIWATHFPRKGNARCILRCGSKLTRRTSTAGSLPA
jgi:hypothetical protein